MIRRSIAVRDRRTRPLAALLAILAAGALFVLATPAAWAHNALESTSPADGSTVATTPSQIVLTFNEQAVATGTAIQISGPSGDVTSGQPKLSGNRVTQAIGAGSPAGKYTVHWRVTSADGHPVSGTFTFTSESASSAESGQSGAPSSAAPSANEAPGPGQPAERSSGGSSLPWVLLVALVIIVAGGLVATRRRGGRR